MLATDSRQMIARIEEREREATGIPNLKVKHTRVFGYYRSHQDPFITGPGALSKKKQTIMNGERYVTEELRSLEEKITSAEIKRLAKEAMFLETLREKLSENAHRFLDTARKSGCFGCDLCVCSSEY